MLSKVSLVLLLATAVSAGRRFYGSPYNQPIYAYGYAAAEDQPVYTEEKTPEEAKTAAGGGQPFQFGYQIQDDDGNTQVRQETGDEFGRVKGSYGYKDAFGIYRQVTYVADENGFRAVIKSNEPGVQSDSPADVQIQADEPPNTIQEEKTAAAFATASKIPIGIGPAYSEPYRYVQPYHGTIRAAVPIGSYAVPHATVPIPVVKRPVPSGGTFYRYQSARINPSKYY